MELLYLLRSTLCLSFIRGKKDIVIILTLNTLHRFFIKIRIEIRHKVHVRGPGYFLKDKIRNLGKLRNKKFDFISFGLNFLKPKSLI